MIQGGRKTLECPSLVSLHTRGKKKQSKCEIYTKKGRKRGGKLVEVVIMSFYVNSQAMLVYHNIIVSLAMYLLINITIVYGSTPLSKTSSSRAPRAPTTLKKLGRKRKPTLRFPRF